ncbi:lysosomal alpha-mannosidase-like [Haemaphysalis longicornis]
MLASFQRPILLYSLLSLIAGLWTNSAVRAANPCELKGCPEPKPDHINVHLLSHSHNDAGWLNTVNTIYDHFVRDIYTTTTKALSENPSRRYVSAENVFFTRWWHEQPDDVRETVRDLVQSGQLQFVGGGWTQNDEAVTHYTAIIDQMTLGLRFLNDTFGPQCGVPSAAWQADPFGHSLAQAALFARMGFSSVMLGRISYDRKAAWQKNRTMEFIWEVDNRQQGGDGEHLLAWVPEEKYGTASPLCFDTLGCGFHLKQIPGEDEAAGFLLHYARAQAKVYSNDTVHVMAGDDLAYTRAQFRFEKQDAVIELVNDRDSTEPRQVPVHVMYSTPACYVEALHGASRTWPHFSGDLLPYTNTVNSTWAGFYTTRPNLKMMVRYANGFLQASKQLNVLGAQNTSIDNVRKLGEAVATLQHHDAITGTCTQHVAKDYANILYEGIKACERDIAASLVSLLDPTVPAVKEVAEGFHFCHLLNQSDCPPTQRQRKFTVLVYNPASVPVSPYVRLPLGGDLEPLYKVKGPGGAEVVSQRYRVDFDPKTGLISSVTLKKSGATVQLRQMFAAYLYQGYNYWHRTLQPGHYVFSAHRKAVDITDSALHHVVKGPVVQEIRQIFTEYVSQVVTLHKHSPFIEFTWTVGPLTKLLNELRHEMSGADVISHFETDLATEGFSTDSNGWRNVHRV